MNRNTTLWSCEEKDSDMFPAKQLPAATLLVMLIAAVAIAASGCKSEVHKSASSDVAAGSVSTKSISPSASGDETLIKETIKKDSKFAECEVYKLDFKEVDCSDVPMMSGGGKCEYSSSQSARVLRLLDEAGLAKSIANNSDGDWLWSKTTQADAAIGKTLIQDREGTPSSIWLGSAYANAVPFRWKIITGCREFSGVDATTALADGLKVDFSWKWKPTEVGLADGMSPARQRAVAYFNLANGELSLDQIQFGAESSR